MAVPAAHLDVLPVEGEAHLGHGEAVDVPFEVGRVVLEAVLSTLAVLEQESVAAPETESQ